MDEARTVEESGDAVGLRGRLGLAGGILLAEYLLVSFRFDALSVAERGGLWSYVGRVGAVAPLAIVVATSLILLRGGGTWVHESLPKRPNRVLLALHAALFAAFLAVTRSVFGGEEPQGSSLLWLSLFAALGVASGLSLLVGFTGTVLLRRVASLSVLLAGGVGLLAWVAGQFTVELWTALAQATLSVVAAMLSAVDSGVSADPPNFTLQLRDFEVHVSAECSGLEGVGLIAVLLGAYLVAFRERLRLPNALWLLPIGIVTVWFGNALRIAVLMLVGAHWDAELAYGGFHSKLGWVLFCAVTLGLVALAQRLPFFSAERTRDQEDTGENPTAGFLMPALALNATALATSMFAREIDRFYALRLVFAALMLYLFRRYYRDLSRSVSSSAVAAGILAGVLWLVTEPAAQASEPIEIDWLWLATRTLGSVLIVPVVEELAFRGCLLRWLIARDFTSVPFTAWTPWAVLGSSLVFGMLHERWFAATLAGALYAALQIRRGRMMDAVAAHAATNAVISGWVLWTGELAYWS